LFVLSRNRREARDPFHTCEVQTQLIHWTALLLARGPMMAALAKLLSGATGIEVDEDTLRPVLILSAAGLLLSLLLILAGCDLSAAPDWLPPA
jgi:hypothetical protein